MRCLRAVLLAALLPSGVLGQGPAPMASNDANKAKSFAIEFLLRSADSAQVPAPLASSDVDEAVKRGLEFLERVSREARNSLDYRPCAGPADTRNGGATILIRFELQGRSSDDAKERHFVGDEFELFICTQRELLGSPELLRDVKEDSRLAKLEWGRKFHDRWGWFADNLRITRPGKAALLRVSIAGDEPRELAKVLEKLVKVYQEHDRERIAEVFPVIVIDRDGSAMRSN